MKLVIFLPPHLFIFPPFLPLSSGPLSIQTVYLGQASSFMCTTPRQSGWTERRGESRWLRGPALSLRTHTILYSPLSYLLLHSNRQTNVPWKFTLGVKGRWQRLRDAGSYVKAWRSFLFFSFFFISRVVVDYLAVQPVRAEVKHYSRCGALAFGLGTGCSPTLSSSLLFKAAQASFLFWVYSHSPALQLVASEQTHTHTHTPWAAARLPPLLLPHISSSFSAAALL